MRQIRENGSHPENNQALRNRTKSCRRYRTVVEYLPRRRDRGDRRRRAGQKEPGEIQMEFHTLMGERAEEGTDQRQGGDRQPEAVFQGIVPKAKNPDRHRRLLRMGQEGKGEGLHIHTH